MHKKLSLRSANLIGQTSLKIYVEPYAKLKIDFGWLNAAHPVGANDSQ